MSLKQKIDNFLANFSRIPVSQKIFFVKHLSVMIKAGVSLAKALKTLSSQIDNPKFRKALMDISQEVEKGKTLTESLEKYPKIFSPLFINMIKSGEKSGKLEEVLNRLNIQMKKDYEIVSKVKGAMIYPSVVIFAMIGIGTFMTLVVLPKLVTLFEDMEAKLPLITRILIGFSHFIASYGLWVLLGLIIIIVSFTKVLTTPKGKYYFHFLILKTPIIAPIVKKINLARFARTFSSLLKTDIPIVETFEITSKVVGNSLYQNFLSEAASEVKKGINIAEILKKNPLLFTAVTTQMIAVGEETGSLDEVLEDLASFYEDEVNQIMSNLPSVIEPILILLLGLGVGALAMAIVMPMYSLTEQF